MDAAPSPSPSKAMSTASSSRLQMIPRCTRRSPTARTTEAPAVGDCNSLTAWPRHGAVSRAQTGKARSSGSASPSDDLPWAPMTILGLRPVFIELGNIAHGGQPLEHSFEQIVQVPARVLPTSVEASITLISAGHPTPAAVSDSAAADTLDETQYDTDR